jgi:hypothetical protein
MPVGGKIEERPNARKLAGRRSGTEAFSSALSEKCAKVRCADVEEAHFLDLFAPVAAEEPDQPRSSRDIGSHGVRRAATIMLKVICPARRKRLCGMNQLYGCVSHLRIIAARLRPRNISNSEP